MVNHSHRPGYCFSFYCGAQLITVFFGHLLAVIEQWVPEASGQYHRRGKHRPCQAPPSSFVAARLSEALFKKAFQSTFISAKVGDADNILTRILYTLVNNTTIVLRCGTILLSLIAKLLPGPLLFELINK